VRKFVYAESKNTPNQQKEATANHLFRVCNSVKTEKIKFVSANKMLNLLILSNLDSQ